MVTKAFEILDITGHIVYAKDEEQALKYFYEGKTSKGDRWPEVRELQRRTWSEELIDH